MTGINGCQRKAQWALGAGIVTFVLIVAPVRSQVSADQSAKVHSHLFTANSTDTIPALMAKTKGDVTVTRFENSGLQSAMPEMPGAPLFRVKELTCISSLAVVATARSGISHMTSDKTFLYTDWTFAVDEVLKNSAKSPVNVDQLITVARPGGNLQIQGRRVYAIDKNFSDFQSGKSYLLYLEYIPDTGAFRAIQDNSFAIVGTKVEHLTSNALFPELDDAGLDRVRHDTMVSATQCPVSEAKP
jgi:hypothetical protein